jgi:hypothetical protein
LLGNDTWVTVSTQNTLSSRNFAPIAYISNSIYAIGGQRPVEENLVTLSDVAQVSLDGNGTWINLSSLKNPLIDTVVVSFYPYIYAYGGCSRFELVLGIGLRCMNVSSELLKYDVTTSGK